LVGLAGGVIFVPCGKVKAEIKEPPFVMNVIVKDADGKLELGEAIDDVVEVTELDIDEELVEVSDEEVDKIELVYIELEGVMEVQEARKTKHKDVKE